MIRTLMTACLVVGATEVSAADSPGPPADPPKAPVRAKLEKKAPEFVLTDIDGKQHKLSNYSGRIVVLEWFNAECPYSGKEEPHAIHATPKAALLRKNLRKVDPTLVYLIIDSTARNHTKAEILDGDKKARARWKIDVPILVDFDGKVGHTYDAQTTPHMFVIDTEGLLRYQGAFDDDRLSKKGNAATNHVLESVKKIKSGEAPNPTHIRPWGCGVKYQ